MVQSLEEYIAAVNLINNKWGRDSGTTHAWYRGQGDVQWELRPSIYRGGGTSQHERELVRDFKLNALRFLDHMPMNYFECLWLMQHYGIPTRVLDWTESSLVALYFCALDFNNNCNGVVWMLDAWSLNMTSITQHSVPTADHPKLAGHILDMNPSNFERYPKADFPVAIRPQRSSPRIIAQKGMFTIHGKTDMSLNQFAAKNSIKLADITIDGNSKLKILRELCMAGISHSVLFPELEGLAKEISFRYSIEYLGASGNSHHHKGF